MSSVAVAIIVAVVVYGLIQIAQLLESSTSDALHYRLVNGLKVYLIVAALLTIMAGVRLADTFIRQNEVLQSQLLETIYTISFYVLTPVIVFLIIIGFVMIYNYFKKQVRHDENDGFQVVGRG